MLVAGYVSTLEEWSQFEISWKLTLAKYDVPFFKMSEFIGRRKEYSHPKWQVESYRAQLLSDLSQIIRGWTAASVACGMKKELFDEYNAIYKLDQRFNTFAICARDCAAQVRNYIRKEVKSDLPIAYIFDQGDEGKGFLINEMQASNLPLPAFKRSRPDPDLDPDDPRAVAGVRLRRLGIAARKGRFRRRQDSKGVAQVASCVENQEKDLEGNQRARPSRSYPGCENWETEWLTRVLQFSCPPVWAEALSFPGEAVGMKRLLGLITLIAVVPSLWAGEAKEYPLTLRVVETDAISSKADGTRTTTTCAGGPGIEEVTCESKQIPGATHTQLVSVAEASDGKTYVIECVLGVGGAFLAGAGQGMSASAGVPMVSGCKVPPGTYKARWDKGRLKMLHDKNGKLKETAFAVLSSAPTPVPENGQGRGGALLWSVALRRPSCIFRLLRRGRTLNSTAVLSGRHLLRSWFFLVITP